MQKMEQKFSNKADNSGNSEKKVEEYKPTTEVSGLDLNSEPEIDEHIHDDFVNKRDNQLIT